MQVRLDGVKISDSAIGSNFDFLGSSNLNGISNIEILKGAASAAYGAGAIGGVLSVDTAKGAGAPSSPLFAESGSYNSWLGSLITQGEVDNFAYNLGITREDTQNDSDEPVSGNDFQQTSYFGRFDVALGQGSSLGLSVRGGEMYYENNANTYVNPLTKTPQKGNYDYEFTSLFLESQLSETWGTRLTLGFSEEDYEHVGYQEDFAGFPTYAPLGTYSENPFDKNTDRYSFYWDNEFVWTDSHTTVIG
mgnify:CR=1 FL=1